MSVKDTIEQRRAYRSLESLYIKTGLINELAKMVRITPSYGNYKP